MEDGKGQIVHDSVLMVIAVRVYIHTNAEARQTEIKVGTLGTSDAHTVADVPLTIVAVEHSPA